MAWRRRSSRRLEDRDEVIRKCSPYPVTDSNRVAEAGSS